MARILIENQGDRVRSIGPAHKLEEVLEILAALSVPREEQATTGAWIDRPEKDALGVVALQPDLRLLPFPGPGCSEWRKEEDVRFVLEEHDGSVARTA